MKMIDVLQKVANDEIKDQTVLEIYDPIHKSRQYKFNGESKMFYNRCNWELSYCFKLDDKFLNLDVKLISPKPKKYLVKINLRGLGESQKYLNYNEINECVYMLDNKKALYSRVEFGQQELRAEFSQQELQSIKPVREFLEDIEGKYELIEVEENEND